MVLLVIQSWLGGNVDRSKTTRWNCLIFRKIKRLISTMWINNFSLYLDLYPQGFGVHKIAVVYLQFWHENVNLELCFHFIRQNASFTNKIDYLMIPNEKRRSEPLWRDNTDWHLLFFILIVRLVIQVLIE